MAVTPYFNLVKPAKTGGVAISELDENFDIIDTEMHKPPLTVNGTSPDAERDITITTVPLADNLSSDQAQVNTGTYIVRSSGGEASIANGSAFLSSIRGEMVKTGYIPESIEMTVTPIDPTSPTAISATLDRDEFVASVFTSSTLTFTYTTAWNDDPDDYGITVTGTPAAGDQIVVVYVKEDRGTITTATPTDFVSTGWNLFNYASGYARVVDYSEEYGFMIAGTYTSLQFATTLTGTRETIVPVNGYFTVPSAGYLFVTGGNSTDTCVWMTWSDWTEEPNGGVWQAYTSTTIDLSGVMVNFPDGLMRVAGTYDEINLNTNRAYSRIEKIEYTDEALAEVIASGVPYETDSSYIYAVKLSPSTYTISIDGSYTASDHGTEYFNGTTVPVVAVSIYGQDLKGKLIRDVVTISQQSLKDAQKSQVQQNIGLVPGTNVARAGWTAITPVTGQTAMTIPSGANEIIFVARYSPSVGNPQPLSFTFYIPANIGYTASVTDGYYISNSSYGSGQVTYSPTDRIARLSLLNISGTSYLNTSMLYAWYR